MMRWKTSGILLGISLAVSSTPWVTAQAQTLAPKKDSAPQAPHYPAHHPHLGTVQSVRHGRLTVKYPMGSPIAHVQIPLAGAFLRAGFYPVAQLPLFQGQHVFVLGTKSAHPTVMLLPEVRGRLKVQGSSWSISTERSSVALQMKNPTLLGGARPIPGAQVDVFGHRVGAQIQANILAGTPHVLRATITAVQPGSIQLRSDTGSSITYTIAHLPPKWTKRLQHLKPSTPVLAVVSPQGKVLGVLPMRGLGRPQMPVAKATH